MANMSQKRLKLRAYERHLLVQQRRERKYMVEVQYKTRCMETNSVPNCISNGTDIKDRTDKRMCTANSTSKRSDWA